MSTPAVRQVQIALAAQVGLALDLVILVDRTDDEPIVDEERPVIVLTIGGQDFETFDQSSTLHTTQFDFDILEDSRSVDTIQARHAAKVAAIVAAVHADRTLGGRIQDIEEQSAAASNSDQADLGSTTLSFSARYLTPRGVFTTIVGQSGLFTLP